MSQQSSGTPPPRRHGAAQLDATDRRILERLRSDGRIPIATLAEAVGVSRANAYARLERLRTEGVVEGFSARVNSVRAGLGISAVILVSFRQPEWRAVRDVLMKLPEVEYAALTTGEHDALVVVRVADVETLRDTILERLQALPGMSSTQTIFVLDELLRRPYVLPAAD